MQGFRRWVMIGLAATMTLAACGDDDATGTTGGAERTQSTTAASATTVASATTMAATTTTVAASDASSLDTAEAGEPAAAVGSAELPDLASLGRKIVFTANLSIEVEDVLVAGEQAQAAVSGLGGFLFGQETQTGDEARSVLTIKVEPENFGQALQRLTDLGKLLNQSVFADDVTERVVDLQSQVTTAQASVLRLRGFLEETANLADLAVLEAELLRRETELEVLRGRLRTLEDQVALATIVVVFTEPVRPVPQALLDVYQTGYAGHDGGEGCPGADKVTVDEGEPATVCYTLTNTGDTPLGGFDIRDGGLGALFDDLFLVEGDIEQPLPADGRLTFAFEASPTANAFASPVVTASSFNADGTPSRRKVNTETDVVELDIIEDTSLPGFTDAMSAAWGALQRVFDVVVVITGGSVPFLWIPLLLVGIGWWRRRPPRDVVVAGSSPEQPDTDAADDDIDEN